MYALVNDIESYPDFLKWCSGARIVDRGAQELTAELDVGFAGLTQRFSTMNTLRPPSEISLRLKSGPFRSLEGAWTFTPSASGCIISLTLDFSVPLSPLGIVLRGAFEEIARSQMDAFIKRADEVYGCA
jgi:ribosome-associated toxin RatA of RatAB toxin-antitoxin module